MAIGEKESIDKTTLKSKTITVFVDISGSNPAPLSFQDLALSRNSSITDKILSVSKKTGSDALWNKIIIDFGKFGRCINLKSAMQTNEYGFRFFPSKDFKLLK